jgi:hypothetical protein
VNRSFIAIDSEIGLDAIREHTREPAASTTDIEDACSHRQPPLECGGSDREALVLEPLSKPLARCFISKAPRNALDIEQQPKRAIFSEHLAKKRLAAESEASEYRARFRTSE